MPRRTRERTRLGCVCAYASASVDPQLPPHTIHRSTPRASRSFSMSATKCHVVLCSTDAKGVDFPQPRWSNMMIRKCSGLNMPRMVGVHPPPGPPCRTITGVPFGFPLSSHAMTCPSPTSSVPVMGATAGKG